MFHRAAELNAAGKHLEDTSPDYASLTDDEKSRFQAAQVIITRMEARQQVWDEVVAIIPSAKAIFGGGVEKHLDNLIRQYNLVRAAAVSHALESPANAERDERHRALMYNVDAPEDEDILRRTGATNLQALGVPVKVTEAVLYHISGTRGGIAGIYNRFRYEAESRRRSRPGALNCSTWSRRNHRSTTSYRSFAMPNDLSFAKATALRTGALIKPVAL